MGQQCFVKVGTDSVRVFPVDQREKSVFLGEFYSRKAEETVTVFFRQADGKDLFDSPKKRTLKCTSDGGKKLFGGGGDELPANPKFTHYEWLWGLNSSVCRLIVEEPRLQPHDSSTAVICFAYDPEDIAGPAAAAAAAQAPAVPSSPDVGAGRGTGREMAPPGGGRGLMRRDTMDGAVGRGRGRGDAASPSLQRKNTGEGDAVRRRSSSGASEQDVIRPGLPAANSVVEACVSRFVELCNTQPQGTHVIICTGGAHEKGHLESGSEVLAKRIVAHAQEKKHNTVLLKDILQEPHANHEYYMFCNLRLLLSRSGVAKCVIVARDVDIERLLMLWTANMVGLKISISTLPVPTPEDRVGKAKREALSKSTEVLDEINKRRK